MLISLDKCFSYKEKFCMVLETKLKTAELIVLKTNSRTKNQNLH